MPAYLPFFAPKNVSAYFFVWKNWCKCLLLFGSKGESFFNSDLFCDFFVRFRYNDSERKIDKGDSYGCRT